MAWPLTWAARSLTYFWPWKKSLLGPKLHVTFLTQQLGFTKLFTHFSSLCLSLSLSVSLSLCHYYMALTMCPLSPVVYPLPFCSLSPCPHSAGLSDSTTTTTQHSSPLSSLLYQLSLVLWIAAAIFATVIINSIQKKYWYYSHHNKKQSGSAWIWEHLLFLVCLSSEPDLRIQTDACTESGSVGWFFLFKGSLFSPLSPSACSWWNRWASLYNTLKSSRYSVKCL